MKAHELFKNDFDEMVKIFTENTAQLKEGQVRMKLLSMLITHGEDAVKDMWGWVLWGRKHGYEENRILASVFHDLGGCEDEHMQPRTEGYMNIYLKEYSK
jgi:hypothetical protein